MVADSPAENPAPVTTARNFLNVTVAGMTEYARFSVAAPPEFEASVFKGK